MLRKLSLISLLVFLVSPASVAKGQPDKEDDTSDKVVSVKDKDKDKDRDRDKPDNHWDSECTHEKEKHGCDQCPEHMFSCDDDHPKPKPPIPGAPGPIPIAGIFAAFAHSRKIRNRIKNK